MMNKRNWEEFTIELTHKPQPVEHLNWYYNTLLTVHDKRIESLLKERLSLTDTTALDKAKQGLYTDKFNSNVYACGKTEWLFEGKIILTDWKPEFAVVMDEVVFTQGRVEGDVR